MCGDCWKEYGNPKIVNPKTKEAVNLIRKVYDFSCVGGGLHIVLDDWNLENHHLEFCRNYIEENKDSQFSSIEQYEAEGRCLALFMEMTIDERASALALADGFFENDGQ